MDPINPTAGNPEAFSPTPQVPPTQTKNGSPITILAVAIFILLALGVVAFLYYQNQKLKEMLASYQIQPSPTPTAIQSPTPNFSQPIVASPSANTKVKSPLKVTGTVPAGWMFEGVFPIKLLDSNDKIIGQAQAKEVVQGSWQSGKPVEFTATLTFKSASGSGTLVLENDNPSGLPENSKTFEVPVNF